MSIKTISKYVIKFIYTVLNRILYNWYHRLQTRRITEGVGQVPQMQRPRGLLQVDRTTDGTAPRPPSVSDTILLALREVAQARLHLDKAEDRLQQLLTQVEDTRPPEPGPNQFNQ